MLYEVKITDLNPRYYFESVGNCKSDDLPTEWQISQMLMYYFGFPGFTNEQVNENEYIARVLKYGAIVRSFKVNVTEIAKPNTAIVIDMTNLEKWPKSPWD